MRRLGVLFVVLCGSVLLAGCGGDSDSTKQAPSSVESGAPAAPGFRIQQAPAREQAPVPDDAPQVADRKEVVTGTVDLTAADPIAAANTLADQVSRLDGWIDQRTENPGTEGEEPKAHLVVRIPATETDAFLDDLGDLGEITEVSTNRDDVTMQWQDLDARIKALRASVDRLRDLMARAATTAELLDAEEALADRQAELDSLTGQRRYLDDQIALSTLTIDITSVAEKTGETGPTNFWSGVVDGWHSLVDWLQDAVVFAGRLLPWLIFLAVLGAIIGGLVRTVRRFRGARGGKAVSATESEAGAAPDTVTDEAAAQTDVPADAPTGSAGESTASEVEDKPAEQVDADEPTAPEAGNKPGTAPWKQ